MDRLEKMTRPVVATLGVFDGVHRGHQHIFAKVLQRARRLRGKSLVYTFEPHPVKILVPEACPLMLMTPAQKKTKILGLGIDQVVVQPFTRRFSRLSPQAFFDRVLVKRLRVHEVFVGYDFTFGHHRSGTAELLEVLGKQAGITVHLVEPFLWKETLVSSTRIRECLSRGQLRQANQLLGHRYTIGGRVIRGRGIGGKQLGLHTANLSSDNDLILPTGVYATYVRCRGRRYRGVTNIGPNPTFGKNPISIEAHIFNFRRNILGCRLEIEFVEKIREEIIFANPKELATQIGNDIRIAKKILK